jgi:hypothetical protein
MTDQDERISVQTKALLTDCHDLTEDDAESLAKHAHRWWDRLYPHRWVEQAEDHAKVLAIESGRDEVLDLVLGELTDTVPEFIWQRDDYAYDALFREAMAIVTWDLLDSLDRRPVAARSRLSREICTDCDTSA